MKKKRAPAFQFYVAEFLADHNVLVMTAEEVGAYWLLICVCWREGSLPDDPQELATIARLSVEAFQASWQRHIQRCFTQRTDGRWIHRRLEKEARKQAAWRAKSAEGGVKSGASRRKAAKGGSTLVQPNVNSSDYSLQSASSASAYSSSSASVGPSESREKTATSPIREPRPNREERSSTVMDARGSVGMDDLLLKAVAEACGIELRICSDRQQASLNKTASILRKEGYGADHVRMTRRYWDSCDWRGKKGQVPTPEQLREVWGAAQTNDHSVIVSEKTRGNPAALSGFVNAIGGNRDDERGRDQIR